jgi:hypothetical protein
MSADSRKFFDSCNFPGQEDYETDALGFFKGLWWVIKFWTVVGLVLYFAVRVAG